MERERKWKQRPPTARFNKKECEVLLEALDFMDGYHRSDPELEDKEEYWDLVDKIRMRLTHNIERDNSINVSSNTENENNNLKEIESNGI